MNTSTQRLWLLGGTCILMLMVLFSFDRIPQDPNYHLFVDTETRLGLPNFWNVVSNLPFLGVGVFAFWRLPRLMNQECLQAYVVLCLGVTLVAFGSAYYHHLPSNGTLLWDRLPMTVAFMALFAMLLSERVIVAHQTMTLFFLVFFGIAAALYWAWTESCDKGDLRPYVAVQFLPIICIPLIVALFPSKYLSNRFLMYAFAWYLLAKGLEHGDHDIQHLVGFIGGHPLKHIAAALAALCIVRAVPVRTRNSQA